MSTHAEAAKMIRKELKQAFPSTKFSVKSKTYAGGSSVDVSWENGPTQASVRLIVIKYQYGHFNPMTDCFEFTNSGDDIPQVMYVQTYRVISECIQQEMLEWLKSNNSGFHDLPSIDHHSENLYNKKDVWRARDYINRILVKQDLTNGYTTPAVS